MSKNIKLIVYSVSDIDASKKLFGKFLENEPYVDQPYYVGYKNSDLEIGLTSGKNPPIAYIEVDNIRESLQGLVDAGAEVLQDPKDVGGGLLVASIKDKDGNILGLRQQS